LVDDYVSAYIGAFSRCPNQLAANDREQAVTVGCGTV
jgi:hypothetical protein